MITHNKPPIEVQPTTPSLQDRFLKGTRSVGNQRLNSALAGFQLLIGYEWLLSGGDKLLMGVFPASLGGLLRASVSSGQLPGFFAALLQGLVAPNAMLFGYLIEWGETLAGLGLMIAGLMALLRPLAERSLSGASATLFAHGVWFVEKLAPFAATGAGLLGLSFFFLNGMPTPWFLPDIAYGGAINTGLFLAAASVILVMSQFMQRHQGR